MLSRCAGDPDRADATGFFTHSPAGKRGCR